MLILRAVVTGGCLLGSVLLAEGQMPPPRPKPSTAIQKPKPTVAKAKSTAAKAKPTRQPPSGKEAAGTSDMVSVPGGVFLAKCTDGLNCFEGERIAEFESVQIDRNEVTVQDYERCIAAGGCTADGLNSSSAAWWDECNFVAPKYEWLKWHGKAGRERHPVNCVSWDQAAAYCRWAGKRLPTDAEWQKAAYGAGRQKYPWGEEHSTDKAVANLFDASFVRKYPQHGYEGWKDVPEDGWAGTAPVGSFPAGVSPYGAADMEGNVSEFVQGAAGEFVGTVSGANWFVRLAQGQARVKDSSRGKGTLGRVGPGGPGSPGPTSPSPPDWRLPSPVI